MFQIKDKINDPNCEMSVDLDVLLLFENMHVALFKYSYVTRC